MLFLASNSPRREQLLALGGWEFSILAPHVDERILPAERPQDYVLRLAKNKARAALEDLALDSSRDVTGALILAADTTVVNPIETGAGLAENVKSLQRDGDASGFGQCYEILGKPTDASEAESMLRRLRGRVHQVYTGLAVLQAADGRLLSQVTLTDVQMRDYCDAEMWAYIATGDPLDKAGAYAIQHPVFKPVQNLQGCYASVMGLPVCHAARLLAQFDCYPASELTQKCQQALNFTCPVYRQVLSADGWLVE